MPVLITYQEERGNIKKESATGVEEESEVSNPSKVGHRHVGCLEYPGEDGIGDSAYWRKVVEGYQRIHFEIGRE